MFRLSADFSRGDCSFHPAFVFGPPTAVCISSRLRCIFMVLFTAVHLLPLPTYSSLTCVWSERWTRAECLVIFSKIDGVEISRPACRCACDVTCVCVCCSSNVWVFMCVT